MKFEELVFEEHSLGDGATRAKVTFNNGYGASIVCGEQFYTSETQPYELAVWHNGSLCYDTELTDDVIGYLTEDDVTELLGKIEQL